MSFRNSARSPLSILTLGLVYLGAAGALGALGATSASAQSGGWFDEDSIRGYDYTGAYGQFGVAVGRVDFDDLGGSNVDSDASGGFTITGGYRFLPWLSAEGNFTFLGGDDNVEVGPFDGDTEAFAFTFGPKIYPLGLIETDAIPDYIQPYGLIGIGGGEIEIDGPGGSSAEQDSFIARFIIGFDVWATDHLGFFVEGGGLAVEDDAVDGAGIFTVGGQYRF